MKGELTPKQQKSALRAVGPDDRKSTVYRWTQQKSQAVLLLAEGYTNQEVTDKLKIGSRTIYRWKDDIEFLVEIDRLSLMVSIASKAERLRLAMRVIRQKAEQELISDKDVLDWLKYAQTETDGVKLDIPNIIGSAISSDASSVAASEPNRDRDIRTGKFRKSA